MAVPAALAVDHRGARGDRIRDLLARRGLEAAALRTVSNFAWLTGGGDSRVDHASPLGVAEPTTHDPIEVGQAFSWNPSITGAQSEETFLLTSEGPRVVAA